MTSRFPTAAEMASWPAPNYTDPTNLRPLALALNIPMTVIVILSVSCRSYSRTVLVPAFGWDDGIMLLAAACSIGNNIMIIISMNPAFRMGYHLWDIQPTLLYGTMKAAEMGMAAQLLINVTASLTKISILLTYLRIFPTRLSKWFCRIMLAYIVTLNLACFFLMLFQCSPPQTYWMIFKYFSKAKCLNIKAIYYFYTGQNTLSDFLIFLWPAKELVAVKISFRQRVTLVSMFCFGVIICVAGIVRAYYTHVYLVSYDVFWYGGDVFIVCVVETSLGIACGCLPGCKPLMSRLFPRVFGNTIGTSHLRPSDQRLPKALISSPLGSGQNRSQSDTLRLQSLNSERDEGMIVKQQRFSVRHSSVLGSGTGTDRQTRVGAEHEKRGEGENDRVSDDSHDFIFQGSRSDGRRQAERPWRWV